MDHITITIFGATGDLFRKKLIGALFDLFVRGIIPSTFTILGLSRKSLSHVEFRQLAALSIQNHEAFGEKGELFLRRLFYYSFDATDSNSFDLLRDIIDRNDAEFASCSNKLFYLATMPELYGDIFTGLSRVGFAVPCVTPFRRNNNWSRILVEKPFGFDAKNAEYLEELLSKSFDESQIFRIDHYLAKETVQNILAFRFKNALFEPLWSRKYIEKIELKVHETFDVTGRENFYDSIGALKDFGQNHLLQMLALIGMEEPKSFEADSIRDNRAKLLQETFSSGETYLGQYDGYARGVLIGSTTETFFRAKLKVENERWKGVPFYLEHGKALPDSFSEITVYFKQGGEVQVPNNVKFKIQPTSEICVSLNTLEASITETKEMRQDLCFPLQSEESGSLYPYEKLLSDAFSGDQTLFVSSKEVKEEWRIVGDIRKNTLGNLLVYKKGEKIEL